MAGNKARLLLRIPFQKWSLTSCQYQTGTVQRSQREFRCPVDSTIISWSVQSLWEKKKKNMLGAILGARALVNDGIIFSVCP